MKNLVLFLFALCLNLSAEEKRVDTFADLNWGEPITGAAKTEIKAEDYQGKIVVVEEFGARIPECIKRLKELGQLQKRVEREKLPIAIYAIHRQREVPDEEIVKAIKDARAEAITIRKNGWLPTFGEGMPRAGIFLPDGTQLWHGVSSEREFDRSLKDALKAVAGNKP
jgi:hypothetical protein